MVGRTPKVERPAESRKRGLGGVAPSRRALLFGAIAAAAAPAELLKPGPKPGNWVRRPLTGGPMVLTVYGHVWAVEARIAPCSEVALAS